MPRRSLAVAYAAAQRAAARSGLDLLVALTADGGHVVVVPTAAAEAIDLAALDDLPAALVAGHVEVLAENAVRALVEDARDARTRRGRVAAAWDALHGR